MKRKVLFAMVLCHSAACSSQTPASPNGKFMLHTTDSVHTLYCDRRQALQVAGINGTDEAKNIWITDGLEALLHTEALAAIPTADVATCYFDGNGKERDIRTYVDVALLPETLTCKPRGGFVVVVK